MRSKQVLLLLASLLCLLSGAAFADEPDSVSLMRTLYNVPIEQLDLLQAKIAIDRLLDPAIDRQGVTDQVEAFVEILNAQLPPDASDNVKIVAIRKLIYEKGDWNDNRPFAYDMADPLGTRLENKLLSTYLETRLGNCVSMPILFFILADRLGVKVHLSRAPRHMFVLYTDSTTGREVNLETTSGAHPARDTWIRKGFPMTDQAIASGIYMQPLDRRETLGEMASLLLENHLEREEYDDVIALAALVLAHDPRHVHALLHTGSAYAMKVEQFHRENADPRALSTFERMNYQSLHQKNMDAFGKAETLGWRPMVP